MCGIMGASFAPDSKVNRHKLLSALLWASEARGRDASGYAYVAPDGNGYFKKDVPGSQLHVGKLPADATAFIGHTRAATHGSPKDNDNNHPVISPQGTIRLVHNGVIYNHNAIREVLGEVGKKLPDVDSSVIPAMIETFGIGSTEHIAGQAACAWFDSDSDDTIHIAKFSGNPVTFAWLADGSFVFASTPDILGRALDKAGVQWMGVWPGPFEQFREGDYIQVQGGSILSEAEVEWDDKYSYYGRDWSAQTSGGKSKTSTYTGGAGGNQSKGSEDSRPMVLGSAEQIEDDDEGPRAGSLVYSTAAGGTVSYGDPANWPDPSDVSDEDYDYWLANGHLPGQMVLGADEVEDDGGEYDAEDEDAAFLEGQTFTFYTVEHDGDYQEFTSLSGLSQSLSWKAKLSGDGEGIVGPDDGLLRWVNVVADVGLVEVEDGRVLLNSFITNPGEFDLFSRIAPSWVKEGFDKLRLLVGA